MVLVTILGGSADLGPSNKTTLKYEGAGDFQADNPSGKNLHFGIREHAMGAIVNGMSLSKLPRPFGATFFIFSDYAHPELRVTDLLVPWIAIVGALGFLMAWLVVAILERTGLSRHVWHLPLFFLALVVLFSSLIGMEFSP